MATTETTVSRTSTLQGVKKAIKACLSSDQKHPIMLWGPPGIGKSDRIPTCSRNERQGMGLTTCTE